MTNWKHIGGDYYRGGIAVKSLSDGWYVVNPKRGFLHQAGEMRLFKTSEATMEMADAASPDDWSWCSYSYRPTRGPNAMPDEAEIWAET
jgi:hypothetical protein